MSFGTYLSVSILFLCAGVIFGCFVKLAIRYFHNNRSGGSVWTVFCIFLSLAVAFFAGSLVFNPQFIAELSQLSSDLVFFLVLSISSFLIFLFWKILLPLSVILYGVLWIFTLNLLHNRYGNCTSQLDVTLLENRIQLEDSSFEYDDAPRLYFEVTQLPHKLLIPVARLWYIPVDESVAVEGGLKTSIDGAVHSPIGKIKTLYEKWLFQKIIYQCAQIPDSTLKPVLYGIKISAERNELSFQVKRSL